MGANWSTLEPDPEPTPDPWWPSDRPVTAVVSKDTNEERLEAKDVRGIDAFKEELARKRELRHEALAALQTQTRNLRAQVEEERSRRLNAEEERDKYKCCSIVDLQAEVEKERQENKKLLEDNYRLGAEVEEKTGLEKQVQALKEVSKIGKEMLKIRELQVKELKKKLVEINISSVVAPPEDLRLEYEKQIENIRKLRTLYEERAAATQQEHRRELDREEAKITVLETKLSELQKECDEHKETKKDLERNAERLEHMLQETQEELDKTKDALVSSSVQNSSLNSQMTLINNLFSQMLVNPHVDLDRLTRLLKEHHGLITDLTIKGDTNEVAALLVDLAEQIDKEQTYNTEEEKDKGCSNNYKQLQSEISSNLSKVWRVMIELLSHHQASSQSETAGGVDSCYKSIQTPTGPRSVISVSQTFLTLKDLILEKNCLVKEVGRLKTLNNHLENRLGNQEKRLSVVTTELRKTWSVVNKLKAQHKQLHTHEKILRYELQQKRCMLTELKGELQHCRDKWQKARQKNSQTEEDWQNLRKEFAARKSRIESNSAESGYEEDDIQTPPSEPNSYGLNTYENLTNNEASEPDLSEEDIEHSDGNSFDTVIDLLDIECLDIQNDSQSEAPLDRSELLTIPPSALPLTGSELTDGLDQIESEDLAAVLDVQYQNQLLGATYNLSLPSSGGSSPIPTDNDDFTSSEVDISEEDLSLADNHIYSSPLPNKNHSVHEDTLLFGSNSSKNISLFLNGIFVSSERNGDPTNSQLLNIPSTSRVRECDSMNNKGELNSSPDVTPLVGEDNCWVFSDNTDKHLVENEIHSHDNIKSRTTHQCQIQPIEGEKCTPLANEQDNEIFSEPEDQPDVQTQADLLKAREDRLKRLEYQCRSLVNKVTSTSFRSELISDKLDELHLAYGPSQHDNEGNQHPGAKIRNKRLKDNNGEVNPTCSISHTFDVTNCKEDEQENNNLTYNDHNGRTHSNDADRSETDTIQTRSEKLKRLENQCKKLCTKISNKTSVNLMPSDNGDKNHHLTYESGISLEPDQSSLNELPIRIMAIDTRLGQDVQRENNKVNQGEPINCLQPELAMVSKDILNRCCAPSTSVDNVTCLNDSIKKGRSTEEILEARAERFKRLEDQCKSLLSKMTATSLRSEIISNKLDELHSCYGSSENTSDNEENISKSVDERITFSSRHKKKRDYLEEGSNHTTAETQNQTVLVPDTPAAYSECCIDKCETSLPADSPEDIDIKQDNSGITDTKDKLPHDQDAFLSGKLVQTNIKKDSINDHPQSAMPDVTSNSNSTEGASINEDVIKCSKKELSTASTHSTTNENEI